MLIVGAKFLVGSNRKKPPQPQPQPTPQQTGPVELEIEFTMQELKDASKDKRFKWKDYGYVVNGRNVIIPLPNLEDIGTVTVLQEHQDVTVNFPLFGLQTFNLTRDKLAQDFLEDTVNSLPEQIEKFLMSNYHTLSTRFMKITKAAQSAPDTLESKFNQSYHHQQITLQDYTRKFIYIMEGKLPLKKPTTTGK